jgi:hypothetical protein
MAACIRAKVCWIFEHHNTNTFLPTSPAGDIDTYNLNNRDVAEISPKPSKKDIISNHGHNATRPIEEVTDDNANEDVEKGEEEEEEGGEGGEGGEEYQEEVGVEATPTEERTLSTEVEKSSEQIEEQTSTDGMIITTAKFDDAIKKGLINMKQYNADIDIRQAPDHLPLLLKPMPGGNSIYQGVHRIGRTKHYHWRVSVWLFTSCCRNK